MKSSQLNKNTLLKKCVRFLLFTVILLMLTKVFVLIVNNSNAQSITQQGSWHAMVAFLINILSLIVIVLVAQKITLKIMPTGYKSKFWRENQIKPNR